jgi:hypothetical protein
MKTKRKPRDFEVTIKDALGLEWHVKEARQTKYGFDLLYGRRKDPGPYDAGGPNRLIYTRELQAFWDKYSVRHDGTILDLPGGRTTLKRARVALQFHWGKDSEKFWRKHKPDLDGLKPREFEEKYKEQKITGSRMSAWRLRLLGFRARPLGWWREAEVLKLLLSKKSLSQIRAELEGRISTSQVHRLRCRAKLAYELRNGKPVPIAEHPEDQKP